MLAAAMQATAGAGFAARAQARLRWRGRLVEAVDRAEGGRRVAQRSRRNGRAARRWWRRRRARLWRFGADGLGGGAACGGGAGGASCFGGADSEVRMRAMASSAPRAIAMGLGGHVGDVGGVGALAVGPGGGGKIGGVGAFEFAAIAAQEAQGGRLGLDLDDIAFGARTARIAARPPSTRCGRRRSARIACE